MVRLIVMALVGALIGLFGLNVLRNLVGDGPVAILWIIIVVVVVIVLVRNLQTNRKVQEATPEARAQALTFTPDAAKAALYVLRTQFVGRAVGVNVMIDGQEVAQIKSPRFTRILLNPGAHRISGYVATNKKPDANAGVELVVNAGEIYVAKCEVVPQMVGATIKFTPLTLDAARADLRKIKRMVMPDLGEV